MSTESLMPTSGDDSQDADALKSAMEAAFGPGAFALMCEAEGDATGEDVIVPDFGASREAPHRRHEDAVTSTDQQHGPRKCVLFELAGKQLAVAIENVLEIQQVPPIASLLGVPDWLCGITNLRGAILSVVDIGLFLGLPATEGGRNMLVVRSLADDLTAGLIVERIIGIRALNQASIDDPDSSGDADLRFIHGCLADHGQSYLFLNLEELLLSSEFHQLNAD